MDSKVYFSSSLTPAQRIQISRPYRFVTMGTGSVFNEATAYAGQEEIYFDDGREAELLDNILTRHDIEDLRGSPRKVLAAIDAFGMKRYLMNIGQAKGAIVTEEISRAQPSIMVRMPFIARAVSCLSEVLHC